MNVLESVVIILWAITGTVGSDPRQHRPLGLPRWYGVPLMAVIIMEVGMLLCRGRFFMTCLSLQGSLWDGTAGLSCKRDLDGSAGHRLR